MKLFLFLFQENEKPTASPKSTTKRMDGKRKFDLIDDNNDADLSEDDITIIKPMSTKLIPSTSAAILHVKSPVYTIYRDRRVDLASKDGSLPEHLVHDIVRATVSNMVSVALSEPWNRLPTSMELKEMAKSLIVTYPLLRDPVSGHVSFSCIFFIPP